MIERKLFRKARPGLPVVIAVFSYRYDAHLVPDLIANLRPFVHGYVAWDDRAAAAELSSEPDRRNRLLAEARGMGADWILVADPDERFEASFSDRLPEILAMGETNLWSFPTREMFTPDSYRIDGIWGEKKRILLFHIKAIQQDLQAALHGAWIGAYKGFRIRDSETNCYHLRMATPERRRLRRDLYAAADPTRQYQSIGYDYLADDRGMVLEKIPPGREFTPPFNEDHGLWSPDPGKLGKIIPDPPETRLAFAQQALANCGHAQASHVLEDLAGRDPDLLAAAAVLAQAAGNLPRSLTLATDLLSQTPDAALGHYLRGKARVALGDPLCHDDLSRLRDLVGDCLLTRSLADAILRPTADFTGPEAHWRRWVSGPATCHEGGKVIRAPVSVIVLGFRAQPGLSAAVASLRDQDTPCEITVVNSGGGPVHEVLADHLDHIRLIHTDQPLYVGAARNIGIDASSGKIVAFLAGDCRALPGWVAGRMNRHGSGAISVSNPVVPEPGASWRETISLRTMFHGRSPSTPARYASHYGRSYDRGALSLAGYFIPGLQATEDTELNRRIDRFAPCLWAPEVLTTHREPQGFLSLLRDRFRRGRLMAAYPPFRKSAGDVTRLGQEWLRLMAWSGLTRRLFEDPGQYAKRTEARAFLVAISMTVARFLGLASGLGSQRSANRLMQRAARIAATPGPSARRALDHLRRAIKKDPQDPAKFLALGQMLADLGQDGSAAFQTALALDPALPGALAGLIAPLIARQEWTTALTMAETAAETAPQVWEHWLVAAEIAAKAGRTALALAYSQRALGLAPGLASAHARVAALYQSLGHPLAARHRAIMADRLAARH